MTWGRKNRESRKRVPRSWAFWGRTSPRGPSGLGEVFVCQFSGPVLHAVHAVRDRSAVKATPFIFNTAEEAAAAMKGLGRKCPVILLLPRSEYMLKVLELPQVLPGEAAAILRLEMEALVPPEFGKVEMSYRQCPGSREGYQTYEVYISRDEALAACLSSLGKLGIAPGYVLPSAVIWRHVLGREGQADLLVAALDGDRCEMALIENGIVSVRTIEPLAAAEGSSGLGSGLVECLRQMLARVDLADRPVTVGWIGSGCPSHFSNGRVVFKDVTDAVVPGGASAGGADERGLFLYVAAGTVLEWESPQPLVTSNLLPANLAARQERQALYRKMAGAVACVLLAVGLLHTAFRIAIFRYEKVRAELSAQTALIRTEGEAIGRRIEQLEAIRAARATRNDLSSILDGLHEASPGEEVSYSHVELSDTGTIRLSGQADSLAQPFLLPEMLEKQPMFEQVLLRDAGQSKRGEGTIAEFRIECQLIRTEAR